MGRSRMLEMAAAAVAPGGSILVSELDVSLGTGGPDGGEAPRLHARSWSATSTASASTARRTRLARRRHGYEEIVAARGHVVATRRTDLRTL